MDYLAAYKYGADLIRKLATMKQFADSGKIQKAVSSVGTALSMTTFLTTKLFQNIPKQHKSFRFDPIF